MVPPQVAISTTPVDPVALSVSPAQSTVKARARRGLCSAAATATHASTPKGRKNQKTQRQPKESVSQPPSSGPRTAAMPNMAPRGAI